MIDIDYRKYLDQYFNFQAHKNHPCSEDKVRKLYKDRILLGKERKIVEKFKVINHA